MTTTTTPGRSGTAAAPAPPPSLWRNGNFLLLWSGQTAGALGPQVATVALPLLALRSKDLHLRPQRAAQVHTLPHQLARVFGHSISTGQQIQGWHRESKPRGWFWSHEAPPAR